MNTDERLMALSASVELMAHMLKDVINRIDKLAAITAQHEKQW
jgi:hypothetical protein